MVGCFENASAQWVHKYLPFLLTVLLGIGGWWLDRLDSRLTRLADAQAVQASTVSSELMWRQETSARLGRIEMELQQLDNRLYQLFRTPRWRPPMDEGP